MAKDLTLDRPQLCPSCGSTLDRAVACTRDKQPDAGDYTICGGCTRVLRYASDMTLQLVDWLDIPMPLRYTIGKVRFGAQLVRQQQQQRRTSVPN